MQNKAVKRFLEAQNRLVIQSSDLSLDSIASMVKGNAIEISPKYQRRERWDIEKQSALIESFLLNIPVPPIYLAEDEFGEYSVIDGKQRITAIHNFINNNQKLKNLETFNEIDGMDFKSLPEELQNALKIRPYIRVVTLLKQSDPDLKYEVFTRLNTGGENLLAQEIRNVAFRGPYNNMIFKLAKNSFLRQQLKIKSNKSKPYKEMKDAEYVLRFFTLRETWEDFSGSMRVAMDNHMQKHRKDSQQIIDKSIDTFNTTIELVQDIWGDHAFKRPEANSYRNQILQGVYDVQMVPLSLIDKNLQNKLRHNQYQEKLRNKFLDLYKNDDEFENSIRQFTSNPDRVRFRINKMLKMLKELLT